MLKTISIFLIISITFSQTKSNFNHLQDIAGYNRIERNVSSLILDGIGVYSFLEYKKSQDKGALFGAVVASGIGLTLFFGDSKSEYELERISNMQKIDREAESLLAIRELSKSDRHFRLVFATLSGLGGGFLLSKNAKKKKTIGGILALNSLAGLLIKSKSERVLREIEENFKVDINSTHELSFDSKLSLNVTIMF